MKNTQNDCDFYQEKFNAILAEYGEKDDDGQLIQENNGIKIQDGAVITLDKKNFSRNNIKHINIFDMLMNDDF